MTTPLGTARVEVSADAGKFGPELKAKVLAAISGLDTSIKVSLDLDDGAVTANLAAAQAAMDRLDGRVINATIKIAGNVGSLRALEGVDEALNRLDGRDVNARITIAGNAAALRATRGIGAELDRINNRIIKAAIFVVGNPEALKGLGGVGAALDRIDGRNIVVTIDVRGNVQALAGLGALAAARDRVDGSEAKIDVDLRGAASAVAKLFALKLVASSLGSTLKGVGLLGAAAFASLASTAGAGGLLAIVAAASQAVYAVGLLPAVAVAAGAAVAAIGIGAKGLGDAFKTSFAAIGAGAADAVAANDTAVSSARQVASAQRGVEDAARQAARTAVQGARQISDAEAALSAAVRAEGVAQAAVAGARKDARQELDDLNRSLAGSLLDQESATLAVTEARDRLAQATQQGSTATENERKRAELGLRQAQQALDDQISSTANLRDATAAANAAGVDGSTKVLSALDAVAQAQQGTADAERSLSDARVSAAQANEDAARSQADAARSLAEATESAAKAAATLSTAQQDQADALAKLAPSARELVGAVLDLKPAYDGLQQSVQQALFEGTGDAITKLAQVQLPVLKTGLTETAGILNGGLRSALAEFSTETAALDFTTVLGNSNVAIGNLVGAFAPLTRVFMDLSTVGSSFLPGLTDGATAAVTNFADKISAMADDGRLAAFIQTGLDALSQLGDLLGNVGDIISTVFTAGADVGGGFLNTLITITGAVADFLNSAEGQTALQDFFTSIAAAVSAIAPILGPVVTIFATLFGALGDFATAAAPALAAAMDVLVLAVQALAPLIVALAPVFSALVTAVAPLVATFVENLAPAIALIVPTLAALIPLLGDALIGTLDALLPAFRPIVEAFAAVIVAAAPLLPVVANLVAVLATGLSRALQALAPSLGPLVDAVVGLLLAVSPLLPVLGELAGIIVTALSEAVIAVLPLIVQFASVLADQLVLYLPQLADLILQLVPPLADLALAIAPLLPSLLQLAFMLLPPTIAVLNALIPVIVFVIGVFTDLVNFLVPILLPAMSGVGSSFTTLGDVFSTIGNAISATFSAMGDALSAVASFVVDTVFGGLQTGLEAIPGVFDTVVSAIGTAWDKVKEIAAVPVRFVIDTIYNNGIRKAVNYVAEKLGLDSLTLPEITLGFATGGPVWGRGSTTSDSIPARLSNDEHVWTAKEVHAAGGHDNVVALRRAALAGGVPAFAGGGPVTWPGIERAVRAIDPNVILTSSFRAGDPGYHGKGEAADFSYPGNPPARLNPLSRAIAAAYGNVTELINLGGANIKNGRNVGDGFGLYGRSTMQDHNDHVHVASDRPIEDQRGGASGALSSALGFLGDLADTAVDAVSSLLGDPRGIITKLFPSISAGLGQFGSSPWVQALGSFPGKALDGLIAKVTGSSKATENPPGSGVERWRPLVLQVLNELGLDAGLDDRVLRQMQTESGGNPNAVQGAIGDVNNASGDLAKGLMQVIGATFRRYAGPYLGLGQFDPHASLYAGLNYARQKYGDDLSFLGQGHGYAGGGPVKAILEALPRHALGGVFSSASVGVFGEAGREALVPLDNPVARDRVLQQAGLPTPSSSSNSTRTVHAPITIVSPDPVSAGQAAQTKLLELVF